MPITRYTVFDGEIVSENRNGVQRDYVSDSLGSTVALLDNTQTQTDQWSYFPYGESVHVKGTSATPMTFVGRKSCRQDSSSMRSYMQYRYLELAKARWLTEDPIGFGGGDRNLYRYAHDNPITHSDPTGLIGDWCGLGYGKCCGYWRRADCNGAVPTTIGDDCIDKACCKHDCCLKTLWDVINSWTECQ